MKTAVIIPVYNHEQRIEDVVRRCLAIGRTVFVVDDGSTDNTPAIIADIEGITLLHHTVNLGKGAALLTGLTVAAGQGYTNAITIDGDGQHLPEDMEKLATAVAEGERCIVVGCRQDMNAGENVPWTSRFGRGFSNFWVWVSGGPRISDSQSGFRLYPLPEALTLEVVARRYQFEVEILVKAHQQGLPVKEVPVRVVYQEKGERISHFRPWRDFMRNSTTFTRLIFARIFRVFRA
jgi:glycosyltransferase involved in cell wall biosynthesis